MFNYKGIPTPVVFPDYVDHSDVKNGLLGQPESAGFCALVNRKEVFTNGKSQSLNLNPAEDDKVFLSQLLSP